MASFSGFSLAGSARITGQAAARWRRLVRGTRLRRTVARETPQRHRRAFSNLVLHAPHVLRALVRADEIWLVVLAGCVGIGAGLCVTAMTTVTQEMHTLLFSLSPNERLSGQVEINPVRVLLAVTVGG